MTIQTDYIDKFDAIANDVHDTAKEKGWWDIQTAEEWLKKKYMDDDGSGREFYETDMIAAYKDGQKNPLPNIPEKLMLVVSEVVEAMEALRMGDPQSTKIPEFKAFEAELADVQIRIKDLAKYLKLRVAEAEIEKSNYNKTRPYKHGGKKF
jgi:NTP pyrophosphatase (non-canonical NTP hydrolase)